MVSRTNFKCSYNSLRDARYAGYSILVEANMNIPVTWLLCEDDFDYGTSQPLVHLRPDSAPGGCEGT